MPLGVRFGRGPKCVRGKTVIPRTRDYNVILWDDSCIRSVTSGENRPSCAEDWDSVRPRTEVPLGVRFGRDPKCVRGKTVIPRTRDYNVILWDDSCILGLSAILWRCSPTVYNNGIQCHRMYLIFGLSATTRGDALHGSGSRINPIKCYRSCVIHSFQDPPGSLHYRPILRCNTH